MLNLVSDFESVDDLANTPLEELTAYIENLVAVDSLTQKLLLKLFRLQQEAPIVCLRRLTTL